MALQLDCVCSNVWNGWMCTCCHHDVRSRRPPWLPSEPQLGGQSHWREWLLSVSWPHTNRIIIHAQQAACTRERDTFRDGLDQLKVQQLFAVEYNKESAFLIRAHCLLNYKSQVYDMLYYNVKILQLLQALLQLFIVPLWVLCSSYPL